MHQIASNITFVAVESMYATAGPDKGGKQASAACRHRPQFVVLLIVNFVGTDPVKDIFLMAAKNFVGP